LLFLNTPLYIHSKGFSGLSILRFLRGEFRVVRFDGVGFELPRSAFIVVGLNAMFGSRLGFRAEVLRESGNVGFVRILEYPVARGLAALLVGVGEWVQDRLGGLHFESPLSVESVGEPATLGNILAQLGRGRVALAVLHVPTAFASTLLNHSGMIPVGSSRVGYLPGQELVRVALREADSRLVTPQGRLECRGEGVKLKCIVEAIDDHGEVLYVNVEPKMSTLVYLATPRALEKRYLARYTLLE
jgi:hypothetical protein